MQYFIMVVGQFAFALIHFRMFAWFGSYVRMCLTSTSTMSDTVPLKNSTIVILPHLEILICTWHLIDIKLWWICSRAVSGDTYIVKPSCRRRTMSWGHTCIMDNPYCFFVYFLDFPECQCVMFIFVQHSLHVVADIFFYFKKLEISICFGKSA